jgi:hypothetical protein
MWFLFLELGSIEKYWAPSKALLLYGDTLTIGNMSRFLTEISQIDFESICLDLRLGKALMNLPKYHQNIYDALCPECKSLFSKFGVKTTVADNTKSKLSHNLTSNDVSGKRKRDDSDHYDDDSNSNDDDSNSKYEASNQINVYGNRRASMNQTNFLSSTSDKSNQIYFLSQNNDSNHIGNISNHEDDVLSSSVSSKNSEKFDSSIAPNEKSTSFYDSQSYKDFEDAYDIDDVDAIKLFYIRGYGYNIELKRCPLKVFESAFIDRKVKIFNFYKNKLGTETALKRLVNRFGEYNRAALLSCMSNLPEIVVQEIVMKILAKDLKHRNLDK